MKLYHGTNDSNNIGIRRPRIGNTPAFYLTNDITVAQQYGTEVLEFDVPVDTDIKFIIRKIGDTQDTEFLVTTQKDFITLLNYEV